MHGERAVIAGSGLSEAEWEVLAREFEQSGLKRKAFCEARGVAVSRFDYHRYRYRRLMQRAAAPATQLVPVELVSATSGGGGMRVELANGRRIVVEAGFDVSHLRRLIAALEG